MNKLLIRDIKGSFGRFIAILLIILLGVLLFVGVKATGPSLNESLHSELVKRNLSDVQVISDKGFTAKDIQAVKKVQGANAELAKFKFVIGGTNKDAIALYGFDAKANQNHLSLVSGHLPTKSNEVVLDELAKEKDHYQIGDTFRFAKSANLKHTTYKVVGFADSPMYIDDSTRGATNIGSGKVQYFAYVSNKSINMPVSNLMNIGFKEFQKENLFSNQYETQINRRIKSLKKVLNHRKNERTVEITSTVLDEFDKAQSKINQGQEQLNEAKKQLKSQSNGQVTTNVTIKKQTEILKNQQAKLIKQKALVQKNARPNYTWQQRKDLPGFTGYGESSDRISAIANVFPVFFFLLAALITFTTVTRMVEESRGQIGTLKALGFSRMMIGYEYTAYAFWAGIIGTILGSILGNQLLPRFVISMYTHYVIGKPTIYFDWKSILIAGLLAMMVTVGAALIVILRETRDVPASLMRPKSPKNAKKILLERIPFIWKRLKFNQKISYRNLFRFKARGLMTILGIAGGTALILTGYGIANSISATGSRQFNQIFNYDLAVQLKTARSLDSVQKTIKSNQDYSRDTTVHTAVVKTARGGKNFDDVTLYVPQNANSFSKFINLSDQKTNQKLSISSKGVIVSEKMAKVLNVKKEGTVQVKEPGKGTVKLKVIGITKNYVGNFIYMSKDAYKKSFQKEPAFKTILVKLKSNPTISDNKLAKKWISNNSNILGVSFMSDQLSVINNMTKQLGPVVMIFILLSGLLSFVVLYNLNNINISERLRELSTIKVLGFFDPEVTMYVARESIILTVLGILGGFGLGNLLTNYVIKQAETNAVMFPLTIEPLGYVVATALMVVFNLVVIYITHRRLKKIDMVSALKSNE